MKRGHDMPFGAQIHAGGTRFRLWAPKAERVELKLLGETGDTYAEMVPEADGWFALDLPERLAGRLYLYRIDGDREVPDPASRRQPQGVHGPSEVVDPLAYDWTETDWRGRPWRETVLYELHIGTFTPNGTFESAIPYLDHLVELGITAVEVLPVAQSPGIRNWGYDGVYLFAPYAAYGTPEDFKAFVEAAHLRGLSVVLDVVYNHFGPEGCYLGSYAPAFFTAEHRTPWGDAIDFESPSAKPVRDFYVHNALYWMEEFGIDGLRLDAVHAIRDGSAEPIMAELTRVVREKAADRQFFLIAENDKNDADVLARSDHGQPKAFDAQWNDDVHHVMHVLATGERDGYYRPYATDTIAKLGRALAEGFVYQGEALPNGEVRGKPSGHLPPIAFIPFLQNHDQIGNRLRGERITELADRPAVEAMVRLLLLQPQPPMLFMGEEWGASTPWPFFCDMGPDLARIISESRRKEYAFSLKAEGTSGLIAVDFQDFSDPTIERTFQAAKLDWDERLSPPHAAWLTLYRRLIGLRRAEIVPRLSGLATTDASYTVDGTVLRVQWRLGDGARLHLLANLSAHQAVRGAALPGRAIEASADISVQSLPAWTVAFAIEDGRSL